MDQSKTMLGEIEKVKKDVRAVKSDKISKKVPPNFDLEDFRKRAMSSIIFVEDNMAKLRSLLLGERDACPTDLGELYQ